MLAQIVVSFPAIRFGASDIVTVIELSVGLQPLWAVEVNVSKTEPFPVSIAVGVYIALYAFGVSKVPALELVHVPAVTTELDVPVTVTLLRPQTV